MKNHHSPFCCIIALMCILIISGCAEQTVVHGIKPAEISMEGIKTLAVLRFDGKYGETVRGDFYSKLGEVKHFDLIDTMAVNALDKVIFDQIDDPRFLPVFDDLKADGVIMGRVSASIKDNSGIDQVEFKEGTGKYEKKKNIFGKMVDVEIMKTVLKPVKYTIRQASLTAHFKVFHLSTKKIIATSKVTESFNKKYGGDKENSYSGNKLSELPSKSQTLNNLSYDVASQLVGKIAPTRISTTVEFDSGEFGSGSGVKDLLKKGIESAKLGDWETAMELWQIALEKEPESAPANYNLGVAYETFGELKNLYKARTLYKKAVKSGDKSIYIEALARIKKSIRDRQKYEQQRKMLNNVPNNKNKDSGGVKIY